MSLMSMLYLYNYVFNVTGRLRVQFKAYIHLVYMDPENSDKTLCTCLLKGH